MDVSLKFYLVTTGIATGVAIGGLLGWTYGFKSHARAMRKLVLRKPETGGAFTDLVIAPAEDGVMEFKLSGAALKRLRKGIPVQGRLAGVKASMDFRILNL